MRKEKLRQNIRALVETEQLFGVSYVPLKLCKYEGRVTQKDAKAEPPVVEKPSTRDADAAKFEEFRKQVLACKKCELCKQRTQVVFGVGSYDTPLVFVGEGPGEEEDRQGEPFVGRAGMLLTDTLRKFGVSRSQIYIANIVKCRPPSNRKPKLEEIQSCIPFLFRQIGFIKPKIICALGSVAICSLMNNQTLSVTKIRGKYTDYNNMRIFTTFHPAYILRNMSELPIFENDMRIVLKDSGFLV